MRNLLTKRLNISIITGQFDIMFLWIILLTSCKHIYIYICTYPQGSALKVTNIPNTRIYDAKIVLCGIHVTIVHLTSLYDMYISRDAVS